VNTGNLSKSSSLVSHLTFLKPTPLLIQATKSESITVPTLQSKFEHRNMPKKRTRATEDDQEGSGSKKKAKSTPAGKKSVKAGLKANTSESTKTVSKNGKPNLRKTYREEKQHSAGHTRWGQHLQKTRYMTGTGLRLEQVDKISKLQASIASGSIACCVTPIRAETSSSRRQSHTQAVKTSSLR
jgi:hypothetical protein